MINFEKMGNNPVKATEQLQGFEIRGSVDELIGEYEGVFEGCETAELDELFKEFSEVLETAPEEVLLGIEEGDAIVLVEKATNTWGWTRKKVQQLVIFALTMSMAAPVFANEREDVFRDLETVQASAATRSVDGSGGKMNAAIRLGSFRKAHKVKMSEQIKIAPQSLYSYETGDYQIPHKRVKGISINGQPGEVMYQDANTIKIGAPGISRCDKNISVSCITIDR